MRSAFSLLELVFYILITAIVSLGTLPSLKRLVYLQTANLTLQQIELTISYARSLAILKQSKISICPSSNGQICKDNWGEGLLIVSNSGQRQFFRTNTKFPGKLQLLQSGHTNNRLTITENGMTTSNGHFNLMPPQTSTLPEFNLYFNRGLRTYIITTSH